MGGRSRARGMAVAGRGGGSYEARRRDRSEKGDKPWQDERYRELVSLYASHAASRVTYTDARTVQGVSAVLERCRKSRRRVRLFLGDPQTGHNWLEESDVLGHVGRSTGPMRVLLLVEDGEDGGAAILTANVLRILDAEDGRELYRHPVYHPPEITLADTPLGGCTASATADGAVHASFGSREEGEAWRAFMMGLTVWRPEGRRAVAGNGP
jgi:hypothetical protein